LASSACVTTPADTDEPRYIDGPCTACGAEGPVQMVGSPLGTPSTIGLCDRCIEERALPRSLLDFLADNDPDMHRPEYPRWAWLWGNDTKTYVDGEYVFVRDWLQDRSGC
jgi:hypothetical protein